ncbi:MAG: thiamine pyrophosphate-binding protein [Acidimicrobiales bacterium]
MPYARAHAGGTLVDLLVAHDVRFVFGVAGGQTAALYDAIGDGRHEIAHVAVRDERSAAYAADAYARTTGAVGVCDATVGPGTAKLPSGLGEAFNSSIPVVALVSELPTTTEARRYRGATSQALDQEALLAPVTKWTATVRRIDDLAPIVRRAFREATTGRPGAVAVICPQDILDGEPAAIEPDPNARRFARFPALPVPAAPADAEGAATILTRAQRPLLVLGGGARAAGAGAAALRLVDAAGVGVATTLSGKGCVDERHPLAVGVLGTLGSGSARAAAEETDLLVLVGTKLGSGASLGWSLPRPGQRTVQIDVDPSELGRDHPVDALVMADARLGLEAIHTALARMDRGATANLRAEWRRRLAELGDEWRAARDQERGSSATPVAPQRVMGVLQVLLETDDVVVADASLSSGWVGSYIECTAGGPMTLFPRGLAGLGWAIPAAIGAAVATTDRRVVAVMGDGAAAYAVGELATIGQAGWPVKMVVLNNTSLGWIRWYRRINFGRGWDEPDAPATDFAALAAAYGIPSQRVESPDDVGPALGKAMAADGPALVEVVTAVWETPIASHRAALAEEAPAAYGA